MAKKKRKMQRRHQEPWYGKYVGAALTGALGIVLIVIPEPATSVFGVILCGAAAATAGVKVAADNTPKSL